MEPTMSAALLLRLAPADAPPAAAPRREALREAAAYAAALLGCLAFVVFLFDLGRADLSVPFGYSGDAVLAHAWMKGVLEHGWRLDNPSLGAPFAQDGRDFLMGDDLHFLVVKALGGAFRDAAVVFNLFFLLTFFLCTLTALFALRRLGAGRGPAAAAALLYAFTPYHLTRSFHHIFLSAYYLLPLMALTALRVYRGEVSVFRPADSAGGRRRLNPAFLGHAAVCLLTGGGGVYYAFFGCFFLAAAGAAAAYAARSFRPLRAAALCVALVVGSTAAVLSPTALYRLRHGPNPEPVARLPAEADRLGLRVTELLLPNPHHYLPSFAHWTRDFCLPPRTVGGEFPSTSLGLAGSTGFVWLVVRFFLRRRPAAPPRTDDGLALLNAAALLLGTVGGFGAVFAQFASPWIRGYNRISICIAFFALAALALLATRWGQRLRRPWTNAAGAALLAAAAVLGVLDQTGRSYSAAEAAGVREAWRADEAFVRRVEARAPAGGMVFQLPYVAYPEHPPVERLSYYDSLRPYLHSHALRWSYGALKGREGDLWQRQLTYQTPERTAETLAYAGFVGVFLDRFGYPGGDGDAVAARLAAAVAVEPTVSEDGRYVFLDLTAFAGRLRERLGEEEWGRRKEAALHPVSARWHGGVAFGEPTSGNGVVWWCGDDRNDLVVANPLPYERAVHVRLTVLRPGGAPAVVRLSGPLVQREVAVSGDEATLDEVWRVPPGEFAVRCTTDGPPVARSPGGAATFRCGLRLVDFHEGAP
jgi:phosphoglycerol transferase